MGWCNLLSRFELHRWWESVSVNHHSKGDFADWAWILWSGRSWRSAINEQLETKSAYNMRMLTKTYVIYIFVSECINSFLFSPHILSEHFSSYVRDNKVKRWFFYLTPTTKDLIMKKLNEHLSKVSLKLIKSSNHSRISGEVTISLLDWNKIGS